MCLIFLLCVLNALPLILSQQPYVGKATTNCSNTGNSALGYSYNGLNTTCQAYLIFRSQPPYNNVSSISTLLGSDPSQLSSINSVSKNETFETNKLVIAPVTCSHSGNYYQANTSYTVQPGDTYFIIANNTFQGLSTCQALQAQNGNLSTTNVYSSDRIVVPLRCACPTKNQTNAGYKYLLSYIVTWVDTVSSVSAQFGGDTGTTLAANELSEQNSNIYPFTTLLVPLKSSPSSSQTVTPPPPPPSSSSPPNNSSTKSSSKTWVYVLVGVVAGVGLAVLCGVLIFFVFFRKSRKSPDPVIVSEDFEAVEEPNEKKLEEEQPEILLDLSSIAQSIKVYNFEVLQLATDNFSPSCWIKGSVYRGMINGDFAAIKKVNGDVTKQINLLNKISHNNIIRLSGICFNNGQWYLVYEYAANGALSDWIYNVSSYGKVLSWTQRVQIVLDVATGLNYLHSFTSPPCIHKDIKSSNILLDSDFRAKISNLALATLAEGQDGDFDFTRHIIGTKGYMAPEYLEHGLVSTKLDVYAFGVLLLEIITGKEVAALYKEENMKLEDLLGDVLSKENGRLEDLSQFVDPSMEENFPSELAVILVRLVGSCWNKNPTDRPSMDEIVQSLTRILASSLTWESTTSRVLLLSTRFSTDDI